MLVGGRKMFGNIIKMCYTYVCNCQEEYTHTHKENV